MLRDDRNIHDEKLAQTTSVQDANPGIAAGAFSFEIRRSILERVELVGAGHCNGERPQHVQHLDRSGMLGQNLRQPAIGHRAFIEIRADQSDAARLRPRIADALAEKAIGAFSGNGKCVAA